MEVIAVAAQKGGSGKSTLAVHLAVWASQRGQRVALVDLDPQGTVVGWARYRAAALGEADALSGAVVPATLRTLSGVLEAAEAQGADWVLLDTAGRSDTTLWGVVSRAQWSLMPCRASMPDLLSVGGLARELTGALKARLSVVLNAVPPRGTRALEARRALEPHLNVCDTEWGQRADFADALSGGLSVSELHPGGKAALEVARLGRELDRLLKRSRAACGT